MSIKKYRVSVVEQFLISSYLAGGATVAVGVGAPAAKMAVESSTRVVGWWLAGCAGNTGHQKIYAPPPPGKSNSSQIINIWPVQCAALWIRIGFNADPDRAF